jgi:hypothetical protein
METNTYDETSSKLAYRPVRDLVLVMRIAIVQIMLIVHPSLPAKTVRELKRWRKHVPDSCA